jgi:formate/nitrite transporter
MAGTDAWEPREIAQRVRDRGVAKANASAIPTFVLAVLAGAFVALGGVLSTLVATGSDVGFGVTRWVAGLSFSLGLVLVVVAGAELFTGNNLVVMAVVSRLVPVRRLLANWAVVYAGNALGALSVALMVDLAEWWRLADGAVGGTALATAAEKTRLPFHVVLVRGVLANSLVCLAVWLATGARSLTDKVVAVTLPVAAFVANAFEHSIANVYFISLGLLLERHGGVVATAGLPGESLASLDAAGFASNLLASTMGNVIGGAVLVGLVYAFVYLRPAAGAGRGDGPPSAPGAGTGRSDG